MFQRIAILGLLVSSVLEGLSSEYIDVNDVGRLCYPEQLRNSRRSCECSNEGSPEIRALVVDCSFRNLHSSECSELLPPFVDTLDLTWNALDRVPVLASDSLRLLNLMHNNIALLTGGNFAKTPNLRQLHLAWNSIETIEANAFEKLAALEVLDLSHNNLHSLAFHTFAPLQVLQSLSLSWNRQLNGTEGIEELDFQQTFGVSNKLRSLQLEGCSLRNIVLSEEAPLKELDLRHNSLSTVPEHLPASLEKLDLSENPFEAIREADTRRLGQVHELYFEDMPQLQAVEEKAFYPLRSLRKVSFQNSRRLTFFHGLAFGADAAQPSSSQLRTVVLRGSGLHSLNHTLAPVFRQLSELDLKGVALYCDCELLWLKELALETNGRCFRPTRLLGERLTEAPAADFSCERWPRWVYGLIVLALIALCSVGVYLIVMYLRPHHGGVVLRRRVGAGSPYARVTIEPNRQEGY